jgi:hypothetical protein
VKRRLQLTLLFLALLLLALPGYALKGLRRVAGRGPRDAAYT